jgi:hypothetical protein
MASQWLLPFSKGTVPLNMAHPISCWGHTQKLLKREIIYSSRRARLFFCRVSEETAHGEVNQKALLYNCFFWCSFISKPDTYYLLSFVLLAVVTTLHRLPVPTPCPIHTLMAVEYHRIAIFFGCITIVIMPQNSPGMRRGCSPGHAPQTSYTFLSPMKLMAMHIR